MMTPRELKEYCFGTAIKGYSINEVDEFLDEVGKSYEQLYNDNAELQKKIDFLLEKIETYREEEDSLKSAILNSQRMADSITKDAKKRAEKLLRDAEIKSEKIVGSCKHTVDAQRFEYNRLRREINDFRERLIVTYKNHLERIKDLPAFEDESDYPATMEDAVRMAEEREEVSAEFVPESPTEPVASVTEPESVPEMKAESEPQTPETSAKKPFTRVKVEEEEIPAVPVTDTVEFKRQKIEPQKKPISRGTVDEEIPSTGRFSSDEIYFGPDYDLEEEEKKPKNKRRSIFGKRREDEETSD